MQRSTTWSIFREVCVITGSMLALIPSVVAENVRLKMPLACDPGRTCNIQNYVDIDSSSAEKDYKCGTLTYDGHNGTDFRLRSLDAQRAGVNVLASASGRVVRTRDGVPDGSFLKSAPEAVRDIECGNGVIIEHPDHWETQYCHMAKGSLQVKPGDLVKAGQPLGQVGLSGLTEYPHLHFTVRHQGRIADPFAYGRPSGTCDGGESLWDPSLREQLAYQERAVLNAGFTISPVTMDIIEDGNAEKKLPAIDSPAIVAFIRAIGLKAGDTQRLAVTNPVGNVLAENRAVPLDKNKAQVMLFAGRKRPVGGWDQGVYKATYVVERDGKVVLKKEFELSF